MSLKNDISSDAVVSTVHDGASQLCETKGMEVSTVRVSVEDEMKRRRSDRNVEAGFRILDPNVDEVMRERAIWICYWKIQCNARQFKKRKRKMKGINGFGE